MAKLSSSPSRCLAKKSKPRLSPIKAASRPQNCGPCSHPALRALARPAHILDDAAAATISMRITQLRSKWCSPFCVSLSNACAHPGDPLHSSRHRRAIGAIGIVSGLTFRRIRSLSVTNFENPTLILPVEYLPSIASPILRRSHQNSHPVKANYFNLAYRISN